MQTGLLTSSQRGITTKNFIRERCSNTFNNYTSMKKIASALFGEVYKCTHVPTNTIRCMKIYNKEKLTSNHQNNFKEEIELVRKLDHPNIFKIFEFFQDDKNFYLVSEFLEGGELYDYIEQNKNFDEKSTCIIMEQIFSAILYLHKHGIVHRDIKPENVMLSRKNDIYSIKLIDFGTSKVFDGNDKMTAPIGTCFYMAPEILKRNYDERVDIWACGIMIYIMMVGYPPFNGDDNMEILKNILDCPLMFDKDDWESKTPGVINLLMNMLEKNPDKRISLDDIFKHNWFQRNFDLKKFDYSEVVHRLKEFKKTSIIERAIRMFIVQTYDIEEERKQLTAMFKENDTNHDGMLDSRELEEVVKQIGNPFNVKEFMALADVDQNGLINFSEFLMAAIDFKKQINRDVLEAIFKSIDTSNDGFITPSELRKFFNLEESDALLRELIQEVDKNNDELLSMEEFFEALKNLC